jgi:3-deoxy-D-manno-octulosonic-acid transferase
LAAKRLGHAVTHQFIPLDHPAWVKDFYDHWRPDAIVWIESEIWPNLLLEAQKRGIPAIGVNGRLSERTRTLWRKIPKTIETLLGTFTSMRAQTELYAERLRSMGAKQVTIGANLKYAAPAPPVNQEALGVLKAEIGNRPTWLFASTHSPEETLVIPVHQALRAKLPQALTIIMPRAPERGDSIVADLRAAGLNVAQRSKQEPVTDATEIYVADTLGETGTFFALVPAVLMGKTFLHGPAGGGHNPIEPAHFGCLVFLGPSMFNFAEITETMQKADAVISITTIAEITEPLTKVLTEPNAYGNIRKNATRFGENCRSGILEEIIPDLHKIMGIK